MKDRLVSISERELGPEIPPFRAIGNTRKIVAGMPSLRDGLRRMRQDARKGIPQKALITGYAMSHKTTLSLDIAASFGDATVIHLEDGNYDTASSRISLIELH